MSDAAAHVRQALHESVPRTRTLSERSARHELRAAGSHAPDPWDNRGDACRIGCMAALAGMLTPHRGFILSRLLETARPMGDDDRAVRNDVWADEVFERHYFTIQLLSAMDRLSLADYCRRRSFQVEIGMATRLATAFGVLDHHSGTGRQPCGRLFREVTRDLVGLLGPSVSNVVVESDIEGFTLPGIKQRALILTASNLVLRALTMGYRVRNLGVIAVSLARIAPDVALLRVADDGGDPTPERKSDDWAVLRRLSDVMESAITYRRNAQGGTIAEIPVSRDLRFPISMKAGNP